MRKSVWIFAAAAVLVLETTAMGFFRGSLYFDLPLIFIYSTGMLLGPVPGLLWGLVMGFLQDAASPYVFGFCILTRAIVGFGAGYFREMIFRNSIGYHVLIMGAIAAALRLLFALPALYLSSLSFSDFYPAYLGESIVYILLTMLLTLPFWLIFSALARFMAEDDLTYPSVKRPRRVKK